MGVRIVFPFARGARSYGGIVRGTGSAGGVFVDEGDSGAGGGGCESGHQARWAGADDQDVAVVPGSVVGVRVRFGWRFAPASGVTDDGFEDALPEETRTEEGLVVEAGRHDA